MDEKKNDMHSLTIKSIDNKDHCKETRRRGKDLEDAILKATWDELSEVGYINLTINAVALRAKTNKSVMHRRWPSKSKLVLASLHKHVLNPYNYVPDTGDLRNDILILLMGIAKPLQIIGAETLHGLMIEHISEDSIPSTPQIMNVEYESPLTTSMITILKNAELRGEINLKKISTRIISLPIDLIRYDVLTTHEPISDKTLNGIIDDIFLPLIRNK
jgi:hypothetical protein